LGALAPDLVPDPLCELNVIEQARHVCETMVVQAAWVRDEAVAVHGWIYGLHDGVLHDLGFLTSRPEEVTVAYQRALSTSVRGRIGVDPCSASRDQTAGQSIVKTVPRFR